MMTDETLRLYAKRLANYCDAKFQTFDEENAFHLLKQLAQEAIGARAPASGVVFWIPEKNGYYAGEWDAEMLVRSKAGAAVMRSASPASRVRHYANWIRKRHGAEVVPMAVAVVGVWSPA